MVRQDTWVRKSRSTRLANRQNVVNVQALEQWPHSEIYIHQTPPKVKASREARDDLQI